MIEGLANTGRVITSAAAIMVCVFTSFVLNGDPVVKEFGVGLAVAIAIDSTLVRCLLVPAVMVLLGKRAWWLPRWLGRGAAAPERGRQGRLRRRPRSARAGAGHAGAGRAGDGRAGAPGAKAPVPAEPGDRGPELTAEPEPAVLDEAPPDQADGSHEQQRLGQADQRVERDPPAGTPEPDDGSRLRRSPGQTRNDQGGRPDGDAEGCP